MESDQQIDVSSARLHLDQPAPSVEEAMKKWAGLLWWEIKHEACFIWLWMVQYVTFPLALIVVALIGWLLLYGCASRVNTRGKQVNRPGYSYRIDYDGVVLLWLRERGARAQAFEELCPQKKFFCTTKDTGETWEIERILKPER